MISRALENALRCFDTPPTNETATRNWIILPLLHVYYMPMQIEPEKIDNDQKRPDFTVLPGTEHTWYVEAKAWHVALESRQAAQALNYANFNGKRWVVLTNGRQWRLYDNSIQGAEPEKLITEVELNDTAGMEELLLQLSPDYVTSGRINEYAEARRAARRSTERRLKLQTELFSKLSDPSSSLVARILEELNFPVDTETRLQVAEILSLRSEQGNEAHVDPGHTEPENSSPGTNPLRMNLIPHAMKMVRNDPSVEIINVTRYRADFVPVAWKGRRFRAEDLDVPVMSILVFYVYVDFTHCKVTLEIGPGPQSLRSRIFAAATSTGAPFVSTSRSMTTRWTRIYRRNLVHQYTEEAMDARTLAHAWQEFSTTDLPLIAERLKALMS